MLNISLKSSRLIFLMEKGCVLCEVGAEVLRVMSLFMRVSVFNYHTDVRTV